NSEDGLFTAQFVNQQCGWVANEDSLYHTSDGGKSWRACGFEVKDTSQISSFFFVDNDRGWASVVNRESVGRFGLGKSSRIGLLPNKNARRGSRCVESHACLKRRLSIFSALILDSSVDEGTPSTDAAPNGPDTRPLHSIKASSIASF